MFYICDNAMLYITGTREAPGRSNNMTTDNRKAPTMGRLIACEGKTVRHFVETIRTDIVQIYEGNTCLSRYTDELDDYLDRTIEYINLRYPEGWCLAEVHIKEVVA